MCSRTARRDAHRHLRGQKVEAAHEIERRKRLAVVLHDVHLSWEGPAAIIALDFYPKPGPITGGGVTRFNVEAASDFVGLGSTEQIVRRAVEHAMCKELTQVRVCPVEPPTLGKRPKGGHHRHWADERVDDGRELGRADSEKLLTCVAVGQLGLRWLVKRLGVLPDSSLHQLSVFLLLLLLLVL